MPSWDEPLRAYRREFSEALNTRKRLHAMPLRYAVLPLVLGLGVVIALAIAFSPANDPARQFGEEGIVTTLSAIFLAMASAFAGAAALSERGGDHRLRWWWALTSLGFFFFSCDELMRFHEQAGTWLRIEVLGRSEFFRNWNDLIVILYGVIAAIVMLRFAPRVLQLPLHPELIALGFLSYVIHTGMDSLPHEDTGPLAYLRYLPTGIIEESAKLFASTFFAMAMLQGLLVILQSRNDDLEKHA